MKKILKRFILPVFILSLAVGCTKTQQETEPLTLSVSIPDGIPALTMTKMMKENNIINDNVTLEYTIEKTTDALSAKVLSKEADIAIVPSNLAAQTYNKDLGYKIATTSSWGSFYLISEKDIIDLDELIGEEITTIGKNLTPDIMLRHVLELKDIKPDEDVTISYLNGATELAPNYLSGESEIVSLPEPMLTVIQNKSPDTNVILDFNEEWKNAHSSNHGYPQSSLIIQEDVISENKEFVETFIEQFEESINWANENPEELGEYATELDISVKAEVLPEALPRTNIKYVPIEDSIDDYNTFFQVLFEMNPKTIGGEVPDEGIFIK